MRKINRGIIHCSATPVKLDIGVEEIRLWHTRPRPEGNGWSEIGYHDVIRRNGVLEKGREIYRSGAHTKGFNLDSIGICLVGGVDAKGDPEDNFTIEQYNRLEDRLIELSDLFPGIEFCGHRDLSPDANHDGIITKDEWMKDCPCFDVREFCRARGIT